MVTSAVILVGTRSFFFKQKTAYGMRISDWSSDVCSSDLLVVEGAAPPDGAVVALGAERRVAPGCGLVDGYDVEVGHQHHRAVRGATRPAEQQAVGVAIGRGSRRDRGCQSV